MESKIDIAELMQKLAQRREDQRRREEEIAQANEARRQEGLKKFTADLNKQISKATQWHGGLNHE